MKLLIVSGPEASGKTAIANVLAERLGYAYQSKDAIKEPMYDSGEHDTNDSAWFEERAKQAFFDQISAFVTTETNAVIESNFIGHDRQRLIDCIGDADVAEIYCTARGFTSFRRFVARNESGRRHKGHHDRKWYWNIFWHDVARIFDIEWPYRPLGLSDKSARLDTTDFSKINYEQLLEFARN